MACVHENMCANELQCFLALAWSFFFKGDSSYPRSIKSPLFASPLCKKLSCVPNSFLKESALAESTVFHHLQLLDPISMPAALVDLTHCFVEPMPAFPGDPAAKLRISAMVDGCPYYEAVFGMHIGTHLDAPLHMIPGGPDVSALPLEKLAAPAVLVDARGEREIGLDLLRGISLAPGCIVLVLTGFSAIFHSPEYYETYPEVSESFAAELVKAGVAMLGLDTPSPDRAPYLIHKLLLGSGILILENLTNLESLVGATAFEVIALPVKFQAEAAPVRAIARLYT